MPCKHYSASASQPASQLASHDAHACTPSLLHQIYGVCQSNGRIAYKRAGGSRLITSNDHWKSQMRHALYTGDRFQRCLAVLCAMLPVPRCAVPVTRYSELCADSAAITHQCAVCCAD
jgi:hypothetical protein